MESDAAIGRWSSLPLLIRLFSSMVICRTVLQNAPGDDGGLRGDVLPSPTASADWRQCQQVHRPHPMPLAEHIEGPRGNFQMRPFPTVQVALEAGVGPHLPKGLSTERSRCSCSKGKQLQSTTSTSDDDDNNDDDNDTHRCNCQLAKVWTRNGHL